MRRPPRAVLSVAVLAACTTVAVGTVAAQSPPDSTVPDASDATVADGSMMPMPDGVGAARRAWLDFAAEAGSQTFAGGAPARDLVEGNRVIAIGDSLMASTARRYGGELCKAVVPDGWDVEVDAETGRFIDFGERVLDRRLDDDFDAAVVMLGNNYGANPDVFRDGLEQIVDDLAPRPTILYTVTMFEPNRADVNDIIYDIAMAHDNVRVIDWAGETAKDPALLGGDGLHLSDPGGHGSPRCWPTSSDGRRAATARRASACRRSSPMIRRRARPVRRCPARPRRRPPMTTAPPSNGGGGGGGSDTTAPAPQTTQPPPPPATDGGGGGGGGGGTSPPGPTEPRHDGAAGHPPQTTVPQATTPPTTTPPPPPTNPPAPPPPAGDRLTASGRLRDTIACSRSVR